MKLHRLTFELAQLRRLPLGDKLQRLAMLAPEDLTAIDVIVTDTLERRWQSHFYSGPRGGLKLREKGDVQMSATPTTQTDPYGKRGAR